MFKFYLWVTPLLMLIAGGLLLLSGTTYLQEQLFPPYESTARGLKAGVKGVLLQDANAVVNAAARATNSPAIRKGLGGGQAEAVAKALLTVPEGERVPTWGALVSADGVVVARAGEGGPPDSIPGYPIFAEAMTGVVRDGHGEFNGEHYQVAGAPIVTGDQAQGAVLLGYKFDAALAEKLTKTLGHPVVLLASGKKLGSGLTDISAEQLKDALTEVPIGTAKVELPIPIPLPLPLLVADRGKYQPGVVPTFGAAGRAPTAIVAVDRTPALRTIAMAQVGVVSATLALAIILMALAISVLRSISKPMEQIMDHLSAFAQGSAVGILPEAALSGPFVRLGKQINMILQAPPPGSAPRSGVPPVNPMSSPTLDDPTLPALDGPPSPPPDENGTGDLEASFPGLGVGGGPPAIPADSEVPGPAGNFAPPLTEAPVSDQLGESSLSGLFDESSSAGGDPLAAFRVPSGMSTGGPPPPVPADTSGAVLPTAGPPALPGGAAPSAPSAPATAGDYNPDATVMFQVPQELIKESAASGTGAAVGGPGPSPMPPAVEDRTVVAQVPSELLSAAAPRPDVSADEDAHYRDVYQEFIATRRQCGEDVDQLTYERFVAKLMKNRQQIINKYNSRSVRFQVYVKQGKAALRAVPVRD